jgi:predicted lipid-binding transport protein (Tim44 family)
MFLVSWKKPLARGLVVAVAALLLAAGQADARAGRGGGGFGSRGSRTFQAPPATPTAPRPAAPVDRSVTQPGPTVNPGFQRPAGPMAPRGGFFSTRGGFMGGLLGAGLFGMLLGYGLFGGLGGLGSILGLLLQLALVFFLIRLALRFFQRRAQPGLAGGPDIFRRQPQADPAATYRHTTPAGGMGASARGREEVPIAQADLDAFERALQTVQKAYGEEDVATLRTVATPEIAGYLAEELAQNASRGVVNRIEDVRLLQGDVAESWREGAVDYCSVAMRFGLKDWTVERATGRVVEGDPGRPTEATELWTFRRPRGGSWQLSAIQQA